MLCHYAECLNVECNILFAIVLNIVMLSVTVSCSLSKYFVWRLINLKKWNYVIFNYITKVVPNNVLKLTKMINYIVNDTFHKYLINIRKLDVS